MKLLLCILLLATYSQVILCDETALVTMINTAVPQIIEGGINEGKLPGGPYYVHHIIKSSIGAQDSHLTLDVRMLDNQTVVTVKATIDNTDLTVKTSCFTSKIGEKVWTWTQAWTFSWQYYAPDGRGVYCPNNIQQDYWTWNYYELSPEQLTFDSKIKLAYENLEEAKKNGEWKDILERLDPKVPPSSYWMHVGSDFLSVTQYVGWDSNRWIDYYFYSVYQPCTGDRHLFQLIRDLGGMKGGGKSPH